MSAPEFVRKKSSPPSGVHNGWTPSPVDTCQRPFRVSGYRHTYTSKCPESSASYANHEPVGDTTPFRSLCAVWIRRLTCPLATSNCMMSAPVDELSSVKISCEPSGDVEVAF